MTNEALPTPGSAPGSAPESTPTAVNSDAGTPDAGTPGPGSGVCVRLDGEQAQHARRSLRLVMGDEVELLDGQGGWAIGTIAGYDKQGMVVTLGKVVREVPARPVVTLATALPKGSRGDDMVGQISQLGADVWIPLRTERSVATARPHKVERYQRLVTEAAKQCGRRWLMRIEPERPVAQVLKDATYDFKLIAALQATRNEEVLRRYRTARQVLILIGPEGDWSPAELRMAQEAGCVPWWLGPHVLRIETAAAAAIALARYWVAD